MARTTPVEIGYNDDETVTICRTDLPAIADRRRFEIRLDQEALWSLLHGIDAHSLGLTADRTGGL